jgi:hypothetical protein
MLTKRHHTPMIDENKCRVPFWLLKKQEAVHSSPPVCYSAASAHLPA